MWTPIRVGARSRTLFVRFDSPNCMWGLATSAQRRFQTVLGHRRSPSISLGMNQIYARTVVGRRFSWRLRLKYYQSGVLIRTVRHRIGSPVGKYIVFVLEDLP